MIYAIGKITLLFFVSSVSQSGVRSIFLISSGRNSQILIDIFPDSSKVRVELEIAGNFILVATFLT